MNLGQYGWILPLQAIDHPAALRYQGWVYVDAHDMRKGAVVRRGDHVSFYLYADEDGLGAEDCRRGAPGECGDGGAARRPEEEEGGGVGWHASGYASGAAAPSAARLAPNPADVRTKLNSAAQEFKPGASCARQHRPRLVTDFFTLNLQKLLDDEQDSSSPADTSGPPGTAVGGCEASTTVGGGAGGGGGATSPGGSTSAGGDEEVSSCSDTGRFLTKPQRPSPPGLDPMTPPPGLPVPAGLCREERPDVERPHVE